MKKYFISFTYIVASEEGIEHKLTYEIVDINLNHEPFEYDSYKSMVSAILFTKGYNGINILHMNLL